MGGGGEAPVSSPERQSVERRGGEEMSVYPADARAREAATLDQLQDLLIRGEGGARKLVQKIEDLPTSSQMAYGDFADHGRVYRDFGLLEQAGEPLGAVPEVVDPDRGVREDHACRFGFGAARRRRGWRSRFSLPPSRARRRALSRAIRAARAALTVAVFPSRPLSRRAFSSNSSSSSSVVLMRISMPERYALIEGADCGLASASRRLAVREIFRRRALLAINAAATPAR